MLAIPLAPVLIALWAIGAVAGSVLWAFEQRGYDREMRRMRGP